MGTFLNRIIQTKQQEVALQKVHLPLVSLKNQAIALPRCDFVAAIQAKHQQHQPAIIAEIKKASPSKGILREHFDPVSIAQSYALHGASCLSVLTDEIYFQGHADYLQQAKKACSLPVLRKDFIIDEYQIYQSHVMGADAILLIAAALSDTELQDFEALANELKLSVLVEIHHRDELDKALQLKTPLIGINNRNLNSFETTLSTSFDLRADIPNDKIVISESGISTQEQVKQLQQANIHTFLIGETLMKASNPGQALAHLFFEHVY